MGDSDDNRQAPVVPSWHQPASGHPDDSPTTPESIWDQARRFLQEDAVKDASREKKVEFLKSKGFEETQITTLLKEEGTLSIPQPAPETIEPTALPPPETSSKPDHPPIVTYPEFLTTPLKPPPLITASGLLNALTALTAASTLVYGATKHLVSPMVGALTHARADLHAAANTNLTTLVDKLERAVSELPAGYSQFHHQKQQQHPRPSHHHHHSTSSSSSSSSSSSNSSAYEDPTELFHRDVGVQTSRPPSPLPAHASSFSTANTSPARHQATRLAQLAARVRALAAGVVAQAEAQAAAQGELDALGADLHALTYPRATFGAGTSTYLYGSAAAAAAAAAEPDDEIRRVKMSIRSVKGMLLSTRSFPSTVRQQPG